MSANTLTQAERTCLSQFPTTVPESDLAQYFTLSQADLVQIKRQRRDENRLGFALQLCTLRYLGFCPKDWQQVPLEIVQRLAEQLQVPAEALLEYAQRSQTRTEHLQQIQAYLGFRNPVTGDFKQLAHWLSERAMEHDKPLLLFQLAAEKLYREKIVRPGVTTLEKMVASARQQATQKTYRLLKPLLTRQRRTFLLSFVALRSQKQKFHLTLGLVVGERPALGKTAVCSIACSDRCLFIVTSSFLNPFAAFVIEDAVVVFTRE